MQASRQHERLSTLYKRGHPVGKISPEWWPARRYGSVDVGAGISFLGKEGWSASVAEAAWLVGAGWGRDAPLAGVAVGPGCSQVGGSVAHFI
jgi:hypothetical protein